MKNKIFLIIIILIGLVSNINSQQTFRKMIYLNQSIGGHIFYEGVITNVPAEVDSYNVKYGLSGEDAVSITKYPDDNYPPNGNQMWKWKAAFYDETNTWANPPEPYDFKEEFLDTDTYPIIMVKFCAASLSAIWFYWYEGPQDTINFPETQSNYNYQWYIRNIVSKMEEYPNKFFILWNLPSATEEEGTAEDMLRLAQFNQWMTDTLAMGLDAKIGDFPPNIYVFDFFNLLKSPYSNYMDSSYRDAPNDYHPNATASEVVAPILVEQIFNAAINYESATGIKSNVNTRIFLQGPYVAATGTMNTTLNTNGYIPLTQPYNAAPWNYNGSEFVTPGFLSTHPDIVDWVLLELRTGTESNTIVGRRAAFLKSDGSIVDIDGTSQVKFEYLIESNYYLVIRHRNHLAVMSANSISLSSASSQLYDFSIAQTQAFGTNAMKDLGGGTFGLFTGDGNGDGLVTSSDFNVFNSKFSSAASGYEYPDWNLDGFVTSTDFNFFNPNFTTAKQTFVP